MERKSLGRFGMAIVATCVFCSVTEISIIGHDCYVVRDPVNCSRDQETELNTCTHCAWSQSTCNDHTGKEYTDAVDVYTYSTVEVGTGDIKIIPSDPEMNTFCYRKFQCSNSVSLNQKCFASGCGQSSGHFCNQCSKGAVIPGVGNFIRYDVEICEGD